MESNFNYSFDENGNLNLVIPKGIFSNEAEPAPEPEPETPPPTNNPEPLPSITLPFVNVEDYGAIPGDPSKAASNRTAIQKAINENDYIAYPRKYYVSGPLETTSKKYNIGYGMMTSGVIGHGFDDAIFIQDYGFSARIADMELSYSDWSPGDNRNAIRFKGQVAHSSFKNLRMISVTRGMYIDPLSTNGGNVFSCNFENLYTFWYKKNSIHLKARSGANTGNVFSNLYCNNKGNDYKSDIVTPYYFEELSESTMMQLNAEWSLIDSAFHFKYCRNINLLSPHIEGVHMKTPNRGLFKVEGIAGSPKQKGSVDINGIDLYDVRADASGSAVFEVMNNGVVYAKGMNEQVTAGDLRMIQTNSAGEDYIYLDNMRYLNIANIEPSVANNSNGKPKLMRFNDEYRYLTVPGNDGKYRITVENGTVKATKQ